MPRREERVRSLGAEKLAELAKEASAALGSAYPDLDADEIAHVAFSGPQLLDIVRAAVAAPGDAECADQLLQARALIAELGEQLEAADRMIDRQARGLQAERATRIDASEPAQQLEAIAGMLYARIPDEMHGREHLPMGTIVMDVLDKRLPQRDPRGLLADNGWPGRRKPPRRGGS